MKFAAISVLTISLTAIGTCLEAAPASKIIPAGMVRVTFVGLYSAEPVKITVAGKESSSILTTGPAVPAFSEVDVAAGKSPTQLTVRFPRLKLAATVNLDSRKDRYVYVEADDKRISIEPASKERAFD